MRDPHLNYLKEVGCPQCQGKEIIEKTISYIGCPNDDKAVVIVDEKTGYRQWIHIPWMVGK